jgi:transcriptional regulator with PAS, ATPase and Fis domain
MGFRIQEDQDLGRARAAELRRAFDDLALLGTLDLLPDGLVVVEPSGAVVHVNASACALLDCRPVSPRSVTVKSVAAGTVLDHRAVLEALAQGGRLNRVDTASDGRALLLAIRPVFCDKGNLIYSLVVLRNLDAINRQVDSAGQSGFVTLTDRESRGEQAKRICMSRRSEDLVAQAVRAVRMGIRVLIMGESGVGKTEIARYVHNLTLGPDRPFIHVNCASIPESLFESEMFGYVAGSFTGALSRGKKGYVEAADGGTLFLDEVGEVPLHCQAKLLKFLEDGTVQRVGATGGKRISIQFFSATNRELLDMVRAREFRKDLYYRLSSLIVKVPSLRETKEIIPDLVQLFTTRLNMRRDCPFRISDPCLRKMLEYDYPGNIREMQNIMEHLAVVCDDVAEICHLPDSMLQAPLDSYFGQGEDGFLVDGPSQADGDAVFLPRPGRPFPKMSLKEEVRKYEMMLLREALKETGSKRKVAEILGVDIATVVRKTK